VVEGKADKLHASFSVKNTGDALLKLTNVKPGCGCTIVRYDSLVEPGKTVKITSDVNISGHRGGTISKYITVTSNAENKPSVRLTIEALIQAPIDVSSSYLSLDSKTATTPLSIFLSSKKRDLKVSAVTFKAAANAGSPEWQSEFPSR
jgi:hypothetical protein